MEATSHRAVLRAYVYVVHRSSAAVDASPESLIWASIPYASKVFTVSTCWTPRPPSSVVRACVAALLL